MDFLGILSEPVDFTTNVCAMADSLDIRDRWIPETDTFGTRLVALRRHLGLDQIEAAELFGVKHPTLSTWERDISKPRHMSMVVDHIARVTGCDPVWLSWGQSAVSERGSLRLGRADQRTWTPLTARAMINRWISDVPSKIVYISAQDAAEILAFAAIFEPADAQIIQFPVRSDDPDPAPIAA